MDVHRLVASRVVLGEGHAASLATRARDCRSVPDARGNPYSISTPFGILPLGVGRRGPVGPACHRSPFIPEHSVPGYLRQLCGPNGLGQVRFLLDNLTGDALALGRATGRTRSV